MTLYRKNNLHSEQETIKQAILEGGWKPEYKDASFRKAQNRRGLWATIGTTTSYIDAIYALQDPAFWQALGNARAWKEHMLYRLSESDYEKKIFPKEGPEWKAHALRYFEVKLSGGDLNQFWESLP